MTLWAQVYFEGNLYHVGHHDTPELAARSFSVCNRMLEKLRLDGTLALGSAFKTRRKSMPERSIAHGGVELEHVELEGADASLQLHPNKRADSGCQGVYLNPHINMWSAVAPGQAMLGYYKQPKEAAIAFSRHVTHVAAKLGRLASTI